MLWMMNLDAFEQISTPDELGLGLGQDTIGARPGFGILPDDGPIPPDEAKATYEVAGSLVKFLLENPIDDSLLTENNFGAVYKSTPLRPLERGCGDRARWQAHYRGNGKSYSFTDLALLWKTYMHFILFSGGKEEILIPDRYRKIELVAALYRKLRGIEGQAAATPAAGRLTKGK